MGQILLALGFLWQKNDDVILCGARVLSEGSKIDDDGGQPSVRLAVWVPATSQRRARMRPRKSCESKMWIRRHSLHSRSFRSFSFFLPTPPADNNTSLLLSLTAKNTDCVSNPKPLNII